MGGMREFPRQNLDGFRSRFAATVCIADCEIASGRDDFATRFDSVHLGAVDVFRYQGQSLRYSSRNIGHIRANPVDDFLLLLPVNAPFEVVQTGNRAVVEPGSFTLLSTQKPFEGYCNMPTDRVYTELKVKVPGALLRQQMPHVDLCCAISIAAHGGIGGVMQSIIELVLAEGSAISEAKARRYSALLVNAIGLATLEAPELMALPSSSRGLAHARVRLKARDFIDCNLSNPLLDCAMIAGHCRVSLRHLHAAFEAESVTVWSVIRELRLQRCRDELLNPALRHQSILQIALKWGYRSSASFARAYHERYGKPPSDERQFLRQMKH